MNKQDIFQLYQINRPILHNGKIYDKYYITHYFIDNEVCLELWLNGVPLNLVKVSDCQLILKRISDMSQEHKNEWGLTRLHPSVVGIGRTAYDTTESVLWLILNGYALSDEWFTNGIAVEG